MEENKIIAIKQNNATLTNDAFVNLMSKTELILNETSKKEPEKYKAITPSQLEQVSVEIMQEACSGLPFNPQNIKLVSGQFFPDIVAEKYFGVEVKSTNKNHWISTGSSIVESTRCKDVETIYMLFGKLGGNPPEFKCRPYQDVLYDIAVTHSPRYLINMELNPKQSIFSKMNTTYDELRTSPDSISQVRRYYKKKAIEEGKEEMSWWLADDEKEFTAPFNIRLWNSVPLSERRELIAKCLILFPEVLSPRRNHKKYNNTTLWLCSYCHIVMPNIRDVFTAGGKIVEVDGRRMEKSVSQIFKTVVDYSVIVKTILRNPDRDIIGLIKEFNEDLLNGDDLYEKWLAQCAEISQEYGVPILEWIEKRPTFVLSK